ncbi:hypothetical protein B0H13DRAFT_2318319 [Mycena leptocephala]|nr:hypothetical protein B0H13DRAFT_2318319 [Mycena leptocephala]
MLCASPLSADSAALHSPYHRLSCPTPAVLLNVTQIVSEEEISRELPIQDRRTDYDACASVAAPRGHERVRDAFGPGSGMCIHRVSSTSCPSVSPVLRVLLPRTLIVTSHHMNMLMHVDVLARIALPPHLADASLPAVFGALSVFDSVHFLPAPPIHSSQIDPATILSPKAKVLEQKAASLLRLFPLLPGSVVFLIRRLLPEKNLGLFVHVLAGLPQ